MDNGKQQQIILSPITMDEWCEKMRAIVREELAAMQPAVPAPVKNGYLSRREMKEKLGITYPTLQRRILDGSLIAYRMGRRVYFKPDQVDQALKAIQL